MNRTEVLEAIAPLTGYTVKTLSERPRVMTEGAQVLIRPSPHTVALAVSGEGFKALLQRTGITEVLAKRISRPTFERLAGESLQQAGGLDLVVKDAIVRDIVPAGNHRVMEPERALIAVEKALGEVDYQRVLTLPHHTVQLEVVGVQEKPVAKGDLVRAGVMVRFSTLGMIKPLVQSYCLRLSCTNGATTNDVIQDFTYGGGEGDEPWQWFRRAVKAAYGSLDKIVSRWGQLMEEKVSPEDRAFVLAALLRDAGIKGPQAEAVRAEALRSPPSNSYEMLQLLTWASSHVLENPQEIVRAQVAAAQFASKDTHGRTCPTCRRAR